MKRFTCFYLLFFLFLSAFSQEYGEVTYRVKPPDHITRYVDTTGFNELAKKITLRRFNEIKKTAPHLTFKLKFTTNEALFHIIPQMESDNGLDLERTAGSLAANGKYYVNRKENEVLRQFKGPQIKPQKTWLVHEPFDQLHDWEIKQDTMTIQGFVCRKAITNYSLNGYKELIVTAWFCPDLPYPFGPLEAVGLPGMVLGLERNNYFFYADKIKFSNPKIEIHKPTKGERLTESEFFEDQKQYYKNLKTQFKQ